MSKRANLAAAMEIYDTRSTPTSRPVSALADETPTRKIPPQKGREGKKQILGWFSEECKEQIGIICAKQRKTEQKILTEALNDFFAKYGYPQIA
jgi:hypothetical protein